MLKGHNWGLCKKCGKDHGPHPKGALGKKFTEKTRKKMSDSYKNATYVNPSYWKKGHVPWVKGKSAWNKGLTKETNESVRRTTEKHIGLKNHNPNGLKKWKERTGIICVHPKPQYIPELGHGVRSSWKKEFAFMLKNANISYTYESTCFEVLIDSKTHKYHPDFKINDNFFIEIKGFVYTRDINVFSKLNAFIKQHPNIKLIVVGLDKDIRRNELNCEVIPWAERKTLMEELKCYI